MNKQMRNQLTGVIASLAIGALIFGVMMATGDRIAPTPKKEIPKAVKVQTVTQSSLQLTVRSQGEFRPRTQTQFVSEVSGALTYIDNALIAGGKFARDQLLARIDDRDYRSALESAKSARNRASSELALAKAEHSRLSALFNSGLVSKTAFDSSKRSFDVATAAMNDAKASVTKAERDLSKTELRAPFSGTVSEKMVDLGQFVTRGQVVAALYANGSIEVRLPIADSQVRYLDLGFGGTDSNTEPASLVSLSANFGGIDHQWQGQLLRTEAEIDARTRMITAVVGVDTAQNDQGLPPIVGLFVGAKINGKVIDNAVKLPRVALYGNDQVLVVDADNRVDIRRVTVLRIQDDELVITNGLNNGERVIVSPLDTVASGMLVTPFIKGEV